MTDDATISVTEEQRRRFDKLREQVNDHQPGLPDLSDSQMLASLLDTWVCAERHGYGSSYDEEEPDIDDYYQQCAVPECSERVPRPVGICVNCRGDDDDG